MSSSALYGFLASEWNALDDYDREQWAILAEPDQITAFNAYIRFNERRWATFKGPTTNPLYLSNINPAAPVGSILTAARHHVRFNLNSASTANRWGVVVHRSKTSGFTPNKSNAVRFWQHRNIVDGPFYDDGLAPGTYFYRMAGTSLQGKIGPYGAQQTKIVT